jgi:hypothetical protein
MLVSWAPEKYVSVLVDGIRRDYVPTVRAGHLATAGAFVRSSRVHSKPSVEAQAVRDVMIASAITDPDELVRTRAMEELETALRRPGEKEQLAFPSEEEWALFDSALRAEQPMDRLALWVSGTPERSLVEYWERKGPLGFDELAKMIGVEPPHVLSRVLVEGKSAGGTRAAKIALGGIALDAAKRSSDPNAAVVLAIRSWRNNLDAWDARIDRACESLFAHASLRDLADAAGSVVSAAFEGASWRDDVPPEVPPPGALKG